MRLAIIGVALGVAAAFGGARVLSKMLFGVGSTDPSTYVAVVATLGAIAFFACYLPALRATRLDPIIAMRQN